MRSRRQTLVAIAAVLLVCGAGLSGCFLKKFKVVNRGLARVTGPIGWYRVTPMLEVDARGEALLPRRDRGHDKDQDDDEDYDQDIPLVERLDGRFKRQLSPLLLDGEANCLFLTGASLQPRGPVFILVHGVKGIGAEWWPVVPTLAAASPAAIFMFRWSVTQTRAAVLESLVTGIEQITRCSRGAAPVVLAHSAGGVVMSFAASRLKTDGQRLDVLTVASPLAGIGFHSKIDNDDDDTRFFNDLGASKGSYSAAAPNVLVTHFRTRFPGDPVMKPNVFGHAPNERGVGVEGAAEVDLPDNLTHDGALLYVARQLAAHDWSAALPRAAPTLFRAAP